VFHHLVSDGSKVVGIEHIPELVDRSKSNLQMDGLGTELDNSKIEIIVGDGRKGKLPSTSERFVHGK
jgi:protein-L-isoaspartate(D-aspartate) O-methyltransferase